MVKLKKKSLSRGSFRTHGRVIGNKNFFIFGLIGSMFGKNYHLSPFNYIITCIIDFLLDPLKPQFYYMSTGLRGSI